MKKAVVVVFARLPRRGRVKTRLIPALGATAALRLYEACLQSTARLVAGLPAGIEKRIYFTGTQPTAPRSQFVLVTWTYPPICSRQRSTW